MLYSLAKCRRLSQFSETRFRLVTWLDKRSTIVFFLPSFFIIGHVGPPLPCNKIKLVDVPEMEYYAKDGKGEVRKSLNHTWRILFLWQFWVFFFFSQSSSLVLIGSFLMSCARCAFTGRMCSRDTCMTRRRRKKALTRMAGFTRGTWGNGNQWVSLSNSVLSQGLQFPNIHANFGGNIFTILRQNLGSLHNFKSEI